MILGLLVSVTLIFAIVNLRGQGQAIYLAGQRMVIVEAEARAVLLRLAATHFGRGIGSLEVGAAGQLVRLQVEAGDGRGQYLVLLDDVEIGRYWVGGSGETLILR